MAIAQNEVKAYLVKKNDIDIRQLPKPEEIIPALGSITLGDLHGNTLKLLHFLFMHGVIRFKETVKDQYAEYQKFVDAYEAIGKLNLLGGADTETQRALVEYCAQFTQCLGYLEVCAPNTLVRLIGDELADRGACDYLTLKTLEFLRENKVPVTILVSNHGAVFMEFYENLEEFGVPDFMGHALQKEQKKSLWRLRKLLEAEDGCSFEELQRLVNDVYKPCLKLMDYELSDDGISLFTHAPVRLSTIGHIAEIYGRQENYQDDSKEELADSIDMLNAHFQTLFAQYYISRDFFPPIGIDTFSLEQQKKSPLTCLIWNRWINKNASLEDRPAKQNGYSIRYIHGHDMYEEPPEHVVILDSTLGKEQDYEEDEGEYLVWNSAERLSPVQASPLYPTPKAKTARSVSGSESSNTQPDAPESSIPFISAQQNMEDIQQTHQQQIRSERRLWISTMVGMLLLTIGLTLGITLVFTGTLVPFMVANLLLSALIFGTMLGLGSALLGFVATFLGMGLAEPATSLDFVPQPVVESISPKEPVIGSSPAAPKSRFISSGTSLFHSKGSIAISEGDSESDSEHDSDEEPKDPLRDDQYFFM